MAGIMGDVTNNLMGLQALARGRQDMEARSMQMESNKLAQDSLRRYQLSSQEGNPDYDALNEAIINSPELSQNVLAGLGIREKRQGVEAADFAVKAAGVFDNKPQLMQLVKARVEYLQSQGRDPKDTIEFAEAYLQGDVQGAKNGLKSSAAALANQGYLDKDIYASTFGVSTGSGLGSTKILDNGTTVQASPTGPLVYSATGERLTGQAAADAIKEAQQYGVDLQSQRAGGRSDAVLDSQIDKKPVLTDLDTRAKKEAENAASTSKEYFDQVQSIEGNIRNYAEGIRLVREEGANTGVIARKLPSLKAASQKLDNLRNRLGLDVVGGTTFGALSEAELKMALDTGMPNNLQPSELASWFEERMLAQQKMADILDGAVQFLNTPGNTLADLRAMQKEEKAARESQSSNASSNSPPAVTQGWSIKPLGQ